MDDYEVHEDIISSLDNQPSARGYNDLPVYKEGWVWNGTYHRREAGCYIDVENIDGMNE